MSDEDEWLNGSDDNSILNDDDWLDDSVSELTLDDDIEVDELSHQLSEVLALEDRASAGGWYFEDYILRYRPGGHADPLIVAWLNYLTGQPDNKANSSMLMGFTSKDYPGACLKCHSVEQGHSGKNSSDNTDQTTKINWLGSRYMPGAHGFNRFTHQSHHSVISKDENVDSSGGCKSCHQADLESDSSESYKGTDPFVFNSDFIDLDERICAQCHTKTTELQSCTLCHNYHIDETEVMNIKH